MSLAKITFFCSKLTHHWVISASRFFAACLQKTQLNFFFKFHAFFKFFVFSAFFLACWCLLVKKHNQLHLTAWIPQLPWCFDQIRDVILLLLTVCDLSFRTQANSNYFTAIKRYGTVLHCFMHNYRKSRVHSPLFRTEFIPMILRNTDLPVQTQYLFLRTSTGNWTEKKIFRRASS